ERGDCRRRLAGQHAAEGKGANGNLVQIKTDRGRKAMSRFANKIVVMTGGTSGIGLAAAIQFIKEGAKVVVTGRSRQSVGYAQGELGTSGVAIVADVTKSADLDSLFQQVREKYGRIDVLYVSRLRDGAQPGNAGIRVSQVSSSPSTVAALSSNRRN